VPKIAALLPDIIHCNDWQAGLVPVFLKTHYAHDTLFKNSISVMTVHNVGYQGVFDKRRCT
jgi:starch synthase